METERLETVEEGRARRKQELADISIEINHVQNKLSELNKKYLLLYTQTKQKTNKKRENSCELATKLIKDVCESIDLSYEKLLSSSRDRDVVYARHIIGHILYTRYSISYAGIGIILNRNHSSVMNGSQKVKNALYLHKKYNDPLDEFTCTIREIAALMAADFNTL